MEIDKTGHEIDLSDQAATIRKEIPATVAEELILLRTIANEAIGANNSPKLARALKDYATFLLRIGGQ